MDREKKIQRLLLLDAKEKNLCERSYYKFFLKAWDVLEPQTPFRDNWHIKFICDQLQQEVERIADKQLKNKDFNINIPPRSAKSYMTSIMLCPWAWTRFPHLKFINSSHSKELSIEHCVESRRLIESDWYQKHWGYVFQMASDQNVKSHYKNNRGGKRFAASVKGKVTGHGADIIVTDDLMDPESADSDADRASAIKHYFNTLFSRLNDQDVGLRLNVQQRLHEEDVSGIIVSKYSDEYQNIVIPAELDQEIINPKSIAKNYKNNLFFPERFTTSVLDKAKQMGQIEYACQFGQRPSIPGGTIVQRDWFKYYRKLPSQIDKWIMSWDLSFKGDSTRAGKQKSKKGKVDYVVGQVWAKVGDKAYLVYQHRAKIGFTETLKVIKMVCIKFPQCRTIYIEDKANGPAIMDALMNVIPGIEPVEPYGDKESRAKAVSYNIQLGNVYLPLPEIETWVINFLNECTIFPNGEHDDQVDAMTQALVKLFGSYSDRMRKLLQF